MNTKIVWENYSYDRLAKMAEMQLHEARISGAAEEEVEELLNNFMNLTAKAGKVQA